MLGRLRQENYYRALLQAGSAVLYIRQQTDWVVEVLHSVTASSSGVSLGDAG